MPLKFLNPALSVVITFVFTLDEFFHRFANMQNMNIWIEILKNPQKFPEFLLILSNSGSRSDAPACARSPSAATVAVRALGQTHLNLKGNVEIIFYLFYLFYSNFRIIYLFISDLIIL